MRIKSFAAIIGCSIAVLAISTAFAFMYFTDRLHKLSDLRLRAFEAVGHEKVAVFINTAQVARAEKAFTVALEKSGGSCLGPQRAAPPPLSPTHRGTHPASK